MWNESENHVVATIELVRNHAFSDRASIWRTMLSAKQDGLRKESAIARIVGELYPDDPEPEPRGNVVLPQNEFVPFFPVSLIKPRTDRAVVHSPRARGVLEKAILEYGFTEAVLLNSDLSVAHGQLRVEVARELGLATVPAVVLDSTQWAYHLIANRLNNYSRWDYSITDLLIQNRIKIPPKNKALLRELGWFTNDVPLHLTAASMNIETWAGQIAYNPRSQETYQSDPAELLWVERTREELLYIWELHMKEFMPIVEKVRSFDWDLHPNLALWGTDEERAELRHAIMEVVALYEP